MLKFNNSRFYVFYVILINEFFNVKCSSTKSNIHCDENLIVSSQKGVSITDMAGKWYGIEILEHVDKGNRAADSCINIELQEQQIGHINLIWKENNFQVFYKFVIENQDYSRGIWASQGSQSVSGKPEGYNYEQFAGKIFVLKASGTNAVLTFCSDQSKLFSVVLSRKKQMNESELIGIHGMVNRFIPNHSLQIKSIKKHCRNHATTAEPGNLLIFLLLINIVVLKLY